MELVQGSSIQSRWLFSPPFCSQHGSQGTAPSSQAPALNVMHKGGCQGSPGRSCAVPSNTAPPLPPSAFLALRSAPSTWMILSVGLRASSRSRGVWMGRGPLCLRTGSPPPGTQDGGGFHGAASSSVCSQDGTVRKGEGVQGLGGAVMGGSGTSELHLGRGARVRACGGGARAANHVQGRWGMGQRA